MGCGEQSTRQAGEQINTALDGYRGQIKFCYYDDSRLFNLPGFASKLSLGRSRGIGVRHAAADGTRLGFDKRKVSHPERVNARTEIAADGPIRVREVYVSSLEIRCFIV